MSMCFSRATVRSDHGAVRRIGAARRGLLGFFGFLGAGLAGVSAQPAPATLAVLPIKLLDTSAEPRDQSAEHRRRLDAMAVDLSNDLGALGPYRTVALAAGDVQAACTPETTACLLAAARARGADLVFVGVVHKSSTLIMQMWARIVSARDGTVVFSRELNFRGDNDESWHRAESFLIDQVKAARPDVHP